MKTDEQETGQAAREPYTQPLLTRHEPLRALTGKSGEKPPTEKDPNEKDPSEKFTDKDPIADKNPDEKGSDGAP